MMKIEFDELTIVNIEKFYRDISHELEKGIEETFTLDMSNVQKIDLSNIQLLLSLNKFCKDKNIILELSNINSSSVNQTLSIYKLDEKLKVI